MLGSIASHSSKIYIRLQKQCSQQILLLLSTSATSNPMAEEWASGTTQACKPPQSPRPAPRLAAAQLFRGSAWQSTALNVLLD